jgi:putative nucleotidyltransferase with HDIG domain
LFSLRIDQVKSGMALAQAVFDLSGTKLLEKEYILDEKLISSLRNSGARRLWVTDDSHLFLKELGPQKIFDEAVKVLEQVRANIVDGKSFELFEINETAQELVEQIILNEMPFAEMVRMKAIENSVIEHMVDVSLLSIMTAKALGMDRLDMRFLAVAALLHDVGKFFIPSEILAKPTKLNETEFRMVKKHPLIGFDILRNIEGINKHILNVALLHHERLDGSGYPKGIKSKQIPIYCRIITIADIYTAIIREKAYRPRLPIYEAGELLWAEAGIKLDKRLTSTFLRHVVGFPMRCTVKLNNGLVGKVVYQNNDFPTRPIISAGGEMLDLSEATTIFVTEVLAYEYD